MADPVFLSYSWDEPWLDEADAFDRELRLRGVPVWRDRRRMVFGQYNEESARQAIREVCSGFVLYDTEAVLDSRFINEIELPEMDARRRRGAPPPFFAGAVFRREVGIASAAEELRKRTGIALGEALGGRVSSEDFAADLRAAANEVLRAYLRSRPPEAVVPMRFETRGEIPFEDPALLQVCWCPPLENDVDAYGGEVWAEELLPALADVRTALVDVGAPQVLRICGGLHLSAAVALGHAFREPTRWQLELGHPHVSARTELVSPERGSWRFTRQPGGSGADDRLVVCLSATKDVTNAMRNHSRELPPARAELHISPPNGPGKAAVTSEAANALAAAIADEIQSCRTTYRTTETRLYLACPWPLAALLGWHLSSSGRLVCHEADVTRDSYRAACELA